MSSDKGKVLILIDVQPNFLTPEGELAVADVPVRVLPDLHIAMFERHPMPDGDPNDPAFFLAMLARAWAEPPMPPLDHLSFARPAQPAFTVVPGAGDAFDVWPRHCIMGSRPS